VLDLDGAVGAFAVIEVAADLVLGSSVEPVKFFVKLFIVVTTASAQTKKTLT